MFACTLIVWIRTNRPCLQKPLFVCMRTNSSCLLQRNSYLYGRIARVCVYAVLAYADKEAMFACTLFLCMRTNSLRLRVRYSCVCGRIACVCVYSIRENADE